ncbi:hypothetical protein M408DRAFT_327706, partial [Serendipita vermifera MAFF 305830]
MYITNSTMFPPDYGDFALQCSDGVVCHFPRYLLGYMSGFFRDMFELPRGDDAGPQTVAPLQLTEPSKTIELLLEHMDPKSQRPEIDPDTIVKLLEAAQKYQVPTVFQWYEKQSRVKNIVDYAKLSPEYATGKPPFLVTHPLSALYCAMRFDLPLSGQLALKEIQAYLHAM